MPGAGQGGGAQSLHPKNPHHLVTPVWLMTFTAILPVLGASDSLPGASLESRPNVLAWYASVWSQLCVASRGIQDQSVLQRFLFELATVDLVRQELSKVVARFQQ